MNESSVKLIVGLGNPGDAYRLNRHNLGFLVVEELARRLGAAFRSGAASYDLAEVQGETGRLVLMKPLTYMNLSGQAVAAWSADAGLAVSGIPPVPIEEGTGDEGLPSAVPEPTVVRPLVVCDDLSLPLGSVRLRARGSSGGQNGLQSVIELVGGEEFPRLRLGIAPLTGKIDPANWHDHVLEDFDPAETDAAADLVKHAADTLESWLEFGLESTISRFNRRVRFESGESP